MRDSDTYMAILEEGMEKGIERGMERGIQKGIEQGMERGRVAEARWVIRSLGPKRLGPPSKRVIAALERIDDIARLQHLLERLDQVASWKELLATK